VNVLGPLCAFLASCTWAVGASTYAALAGRASAPAINGTRALIALPALLLILAVDRGPQGAIAALASLPPRQVAFLALSIASSYALGDVLLLVAARRLGLPAALAVASTFPFWAAAGGVVILGEPLTALRLLGVVVVVGGTALVLRLSAGRARAPGEQRGFAMGVAMAVATSLLWAGNGVFLRLGSEGQPALVATTARIACGVILCPLVGFSAAALGRTTTTAFVPWPILRPALWAFAVEGIAGTIFFVNGIARSPLILGAVLSSLAPILSVPIAWALRTEPPSAPKALAVVTVSIGVALLLVG
jgi:uncharacterized membrane protein